MTEGSRKEQLILVAGAGLATYVAARLIISGFIDEEPWWGWIGAAGLLFTALCLWGMWQARKWALWLSWFLALAIFALGCFAAAFHWSFWLFYTPTLKERFLALLNWQVIPLVIGPLLWFAYFARPSVRGRFH